ncbi:MAG: hypothetical protein IT434_11350 [Phycisphaerales bacterium]|jgi:hypothetical protein|nr:hypothetical protein [Phycisphaerales bacterium]
MGTIDNLRRAGLIAATAGAACVTGAAPPTYVVVVDSGHDGVALVDATSGGMVNAAWIRYSDWGLDSTSGTPKDAIRVGNQLWISDQVQDVIHRFSLSVASPRYLGTISGGLDNIRGMEFQGGVVYVCNAGSNNGAPGQAIVRLDRRGEFLGYFTVGDPFDLMYRASAGELLVANTAGDDIDRYSLAGTFLGKYHNSDGVGGVNFPQQIAADPSGASDIVVAGFSAPAGLYAYVGGAQKSFAAFAGARGIAPLADGTFVFTADNAIYSFNPSTGGTTPLYSDSQASFQFANVVTFYCPADVNADGFVNGDDYDVFASFFDTADAEADFNADGFVNGDDYDAFATAFDAGC